MRVVLGIGVLLAAAAPARAQIDQPKINEAINKGAEWLTKKFGSFDGNSWNSTLELVMLTLSHAGVKPEDPSFEKGLETMLQCKLQYTYRVAAHAMALQRIDPVKHQARIAHCAQWLVDTQLPDGEWGYPDTLSDPNERPKPVEVDPPKTEKTSEPAPGKSSFAIRIKRQPSKKLNLKAKGDISNAQFAILGLKACHDAGIEIPQATWKAALGYVLKTQSQDGGWGYYFNGMKDAETYGSMTCAGICSVAICTYGLGAKEPLKAPAVQRGLGWLARHFEPDENHNIERSHVADAKRWLFYYLYSVERVGKICEIEQIGRKKWYELGAPYLLKEQKRDGSWWTGVPGVQWKQAGDIETADTCFAILFLTKATPPLVATGEKK